VIALVLFLALAAALRADDAPKARKAVKVGHPAPPLYLYYADGNLVPAKSMEGKFLLLTFWTVDSLKTTKGAALFDQLKKVRRDVAGRNDFVLVSVCVDAPDDEAKTDAWSQFLLGQGKVEYGDGRRRFIDDSKWWGCTEIQIDELASRYYGVDHYPESFLIGADGKLAAADVPDKEVRETAARALKAAEKKVRRD
jgi:cytochrome oxidase Cu insertion factor (SCO1/SenC/PrrC family)